MSENGIDKKNVIGRRWVYFGIRAKWISREEKRCEFKYASRLNVHCRAVVEEKCFVANEIVVCS